MNATAELTEVRQFLATKWTIENIPSQAGKVAIVTGGNSGIGFHTALELCRAGAEVIVTVRRDDKGRDAVARILKEVPQAKVRYEILDLASLKSVRQFAEKISAGSLDRPARLDLLINNAGVMSIPKRQLSADGYEMQFATNFLGPFLLTQLLLPLLLLSPNPRVTTVSSGAANMGMKRINFNDLQSKRSYGPWSAYCQSKLADLMFALELDRRYGDKLVSNAAHPGFARTNLQTSGPGRETNVMEEIMATFMAHDAASGALPTLRAATDPDAAGASYFAPDKLFGLKGDPVAIDYPKIALNTAAAARLWHSATELTGL